MSLYNKDIIKYEIIPSLVINNKGPYLDENKIISIVQLILYRLKTGCQWRELPIGHYMKEDYSWQSVYHHFNKWSQLGCWQKVWENLILENHAELDLSSIQIDGTHTPAKNGGEKVSYQGRKSTNTTNLLCISDANGVLIAVAKPENGHHNDLYDIENQFHEMIQQFDNLKLNTDGLFLNGDAGFDSSLLRNLCSQKGIIPNFCFNKRNGNITERDDFFDDTLYKKRTVIEHAFAWVDAFKSLIIRYEKSAQNWMSFHFIAFFLIFKRKILNKNLL